MTLPRLIVVTDGRSAETAGRTLPETVAEAEAGGARAFLFREKHLERQQRYRLVSRIADNLGDDTVLIVASDSDLADEVGAAGVHLSAGDPPVDGSFLVGRSCHDETELSAHADEADYVTVSPVFTSVSKPGYGPGLGTARLKSLAHGYPRPVFALGGIRPETTGEVMGSGVHGMAVSGAVMGADDPARVVDALMRAVGSSP